MVTLPVGVFVALVVLVFVALAVGIVLGRCIGRNRRAKLEQGDLDRKLDTIMSSLVDQKSGKLQYPMLLIRAQDFITAGRLVPHEEGRRLGQLLYLDNLEQLKHFERKMRIVFFSHQWTSFVYPDPSNQQYRTMVTALQKVQSVNKWPLERMFIWVEYARPRAPLPVHHARVRGSVRARAAASRPALSAPRSSRACSRSAATRVCRRRTVRLRSSPSPPSPSTPHEHTHSSPSFLKCRVRAPAAPRACGCGKRVLAPAQPTL
jgi:hypothetical protein